MTPVAERLAGRYPLWVSRVAGHDTTPADLAQTSWRDWYRSAETGLDALLAVRPRVVVIGLSMGALLAMRLAIEQTTAIAGLALLSPAMEVRRISWWLQTPIDLAAALDERSPLARQLLAKIAFPKRGSDIADAEVRRTHPGYKRVPLRALLNLSRLQQAALAHARVITQPTLVIHSVQDHTCPVAATQAMYDTLPSTKKRLILLEDSFHVMTVDREHARVLDEVDTFVGECTSETIKSST